MDYGLHGKTVLVTASSKGLGFATAKGFAREGAKVMLASRTAGALQNAVEEIQRETGNPHVSYVVANVANEADLDAIFQAVNNQFGGVDVLVNNAGGPPAGNFDSVLDTQWSQAFELSLMSVVRATKRALPHMRKNQWGRILNFTSSSIKQPIENLILSNTFRTAVAGLSKSLAIELGDDNILVNTIGPGRIATDRVASLDAMKAQSLGTSMDDVKRASEAQIPLGRYGTPDEFAALAVFLGSSANGYITGQSILVDGGMVKGL